MNEVDCPKCGCENCFHNGVCFECPDCGYQWNGGFRWDKEPIIITTDANKENC